MLCSQLDLHLAVAKAISVDSFCNSEGVESCRQLAAAPNH